MAYVIDCRHVVVLDEEGCTTVAFADHPETPVHCVFIQRAHDYDEQDRRLGMDGHYLEVEDQSRAVYWGIEALLLEPDRVEIRLSAKAAQRLAVSDKIVLRLNPRTAGTTEALDKLLEFARADRIEILHRKSQ